MTIRALALVIAILPASGCDRDRACREGTVFLTVAFDPTARAADRFALTVSVGTRTKTGQLLHTPGSASDTVEVDFQPSYPRGQTVTIDVTALAADATIGSGHVQAVLDASCKALTLTVTGALPDGALDAQPDLQPVLNVCQQTGLAVACDGKGYVLCDGFETSGPTFPKWSYTTAIGGGAVSVQTSPVCRGQKSFLSAVMTSGDQAVLGNGVVPWPNPFYMRVFVYPQPGMLPGYRALFTLGNSAGNIGLVLQTTDTAGEFFVARLGFGSDLARFTAALPAGRWTCLEMFVKLDPANGEVKVSFDGVVAADFTGVQTFTSVGAATDILLGQYNAALSPSNVFYDEFVMSATPVGCN